MPYRRCYGRMLALALGLGLGATLAMLTTSGCSFIVDLVPKPDPDGGLNNNTNTNQPDGFVVHDGGNSSGCVTLHPEFQVNGEYTTGDQHTVRAVAGPSTLFIAWIDESGDLGGSGLSNIVTRPFAFDPSDPLPGGIESVRYSNAEGDESAPVVYGTGIYFVDLRSGDPDLEIYRADLDGTAAHHPGPGTNGGNQDQLVGAPRDDPDEPVVWRHVVSGSESDIYYSCGAQSGAVTTAETGLQEQPSVQSNATGSGIIAWTDRSTSQPSIRYRPFFSCSFTTGAATLGSRHEGVQPGPQTQPGVGGGASTSAGNSPYLVVWVDDTQQGPDFFGGGLRGKQISQSGIPTGNEFQVNTTYAGDQRQPRVTQVLYDRNGTYENAFLVVWQSAGSNDVGTDIRGIFLDASREPIASSDFTVNTETGGDQLAPWVVASDDHLSALVLWEDWGGNGVDSNGSAIRGRLITFDAQNCQ